MANYLIYSENTGIIADTSIPAGFTDVTTIDNLGKVAVNNIGASWIKDWKKIRSEIKALAISITGNSNIPAWTEAQWNLFTDSEKVILANFLPNKIPVAYLIALQVAGLIVISDCGLYFDTNSKVARRSRWEACRIVVMGSFAAVDSMTTIQWQVLAFTNASWPNSVDLSMAYINGYESQAEDFRYGLIDYVDNELRASGLTPINGQTLTQVCDTLLAILEDGTY